MLFFPQDSFPDLPSTLPTIGGINVADPVRLAIGDSDATDYEFSNADLLVLFQNAIRAYQGYRPYTLTQTMTLVANQKDYALPSSCNKVISHTYRSFPGVGSESYVAFYNTLNGYPIFVPYYDWTDAVLSRIRQEFYRRLDELGAGQAEVIDYQTSYTATKYLRIFPTPTTSGDTFTVTYNTDHPLQSNDYFTIPAEHAVYVQKLLQAEVLDVRLAKMSATAHQFNSGTTKTAFDKSMERLESQAGRLRQDVHDALANPQGRRG